MWNPAVVLAGNPLSVAVMVNEVAVAATRTSPATTAAAAPGYWPRLARLVMVVVSTGRSLLGSHGHIKPNAGFQAQTHNVLVVMLVEVAVAVVTVVVVVVEEVAVVVVVVEDVCVELVTKQPPHFTGHFLTATATLHAALSSPHSEGSGAEHTGIAVVEVVVDTVVVWHLPQVNGHRAWTASNEHDAVSSAQSTLSWPKSQSSGDEVVVVVAVVVVTHNPHLPGQVCFTNCRVQESSVASAHSVPSAISQAGMVVVVVEEKVVVLSHRPHANGHCFCTTLAPHDASVALAQFTLSGTSHVRNSGRLVVVVVVSVAAMVVVVGVVAVVCRRQGMGKGGQQMVQ
jgi:hypothetical protein